jgi:hypothetical protein
MRKFQLFIPLLFYAQLTFSQEKKDEKKAGKIPDTYVSPNAYLSKYYTQEELEKMGKIELTEIYMERIIVLTEIIPYLALKSKPGATLKEMGIPETKANIEHMQNAVKSKKAYLDAVRGTLDDVIPYSDKSNIIWSILFFERMIKRAQEGIND